MLVFGPVQIVRIADASVSIPTLYIYLYCISFDPPVAMERDLDTKADIEKDELATKGVSHDSDTASDHAILSEFSKSEERRIMHRIDRRLVVTVGFMYCISLMD